MTTARSNWPKPSPGNSIQMTEQFYWFDRGPRVEGSRIIRDRSCHITGARIFKYSYVVLPQ